MTTPRFQPCLIGRNSHPATDGLLCRAHLEQLGQWLRDVETEAQRLDAAPSMSTRYDAKGGSLASHRVPAVLDVIAYLDVRSTAHGSRHVGPVCTHCPTLAGHSCTCPPVEWRRSVHYRRCPQWGIHASCAYILADRDEHGAEHLVSILGLLHGWAQRVRDEWDREAPAPITIAGERIFLTRQLTWIADQPWVAVMHRELGDLRRQLLRLNGNTDDKPLPGYCVWLLPGGQECGGDLWPSKPEHSVGYETVDGMSVVICSRDDTHRWEGLGLARLAVILSQQPERETA